jgi:hypothetical protein
MSLASLARQLVNLPSLLPTEMQAINYGSYLNL